MRDNWIEVIREAEEAFWKAIATGTPEAEDGNLPPGESEAFTRACKAAATAWYEYNVPPSFDLASFAREVEALPAVHGWKATWEFPGNLQLRLDGMPWEIWVTPDHDEDGVISMSIIDPTSGESFQALWSAAEITWPMNGRTVDGFMAKVGPVIERWHGNLQEWKRAQMPPPKTEASCTLRVSMRPPRKLERGWWVYANTPEQALVEILANTGGGGLGWVAERDHTSERSPNGMRAVTIMVIPEVES